MREITKGTQYDLILKKLKRKKGLSALEAFTECGTTSLHRRLTDLRQMGYHITGEWVEKKEDGKVVKRWKVYRVVA